MFLLAMSWGSMCHTGSQAPRANTTTRFFEPAAVARRGRARAPMPAFTSVQFSSYDRASTGPDKPETWFANGDYNQYIRVEKNGERQDVNLKKPMPLYFAYITAWATEDGVIQFRRDLYEKDGVGAIAAAY